MRVADRAATLPREVGTGEQPRIASPTRVFERRHVPALDGIRGLAILFVLVWHYLGAEPAPGSALAYAMVPLRLTYTGVDLFFVLSGFLIGGILVDTRGGRGYFASFFGRRALRILPLYIVLLAAFYLLVYLDVRGVGGLAFLTHERLPFVSYATLTQNLAMIRHGAAPNGVSVTWSLAVEEQVYLILPVLIALCPPRRLPFAAGLMIGAALMSRFFLPAETTYLLTISRLDAIGAGIGAALLIRHPTWGPWLASRPRPAYLALGAGALGYVLVLLRVVPTSPVGLTILALAYVSLLIVALADPGGLIARALRARWLRWLGKVSYSTYLLHMPVLMLVHGLLLNRDQRYPIITDSASALAVPLALAVTLALAAASWHWFEAPILRLKRYMPSPRPRHAAAQIPARSADGQS